MAGGADWTEGYLGVGLEGRRDGGQGAVMTQVEVGSPQPMAGLATGDVVVAVDGCESSATTT